MSEPSPDPLADHEVIRNAASAALHAIGAPPGIVTRAVIVAEIVGEDGEVEQTNLRTLSSSILPWETVGLLDYARHQVLRTDDQESTE